MQKRTLTQIKKVLQELSKKGWIKSNRSHNTGIGKTLEDYLEITENNIALWQVPRSSDTFVRLRR